MNHYINNRETFDKVFSSELQLKYVVKTTNVSFMIKITFLLSGYVKNVYSCVTSFLCLPSYGTGQVKRMNYLLVGAGQHTHVHLSNC